MQVLFARCAGLDVHKKTVVACVMLTLLTGEVRKQVRTFATTTQGLLALADWLTNQQITHVAMESTGIYWRPVFNILEGAFTVILVNAQHMKAVPGRKTDVKLRHEVASVAVRPANEEERSVVSEPGSDLGFCPQYPAETCGRSNLAV